MKIFPGTTRFNISKFILYFKDQTYAANVILWQEDDPAEFLLLLSEYYYSLLFSEDRCSWRKKSVKFKKVRLLG